MEVGNLRKSEGDLKQQLATTVAELQKNAQEWATLRQKQEGSLSSYSHISKCLLELENQLETTVKELKEEKTENKRIKLQLQKTSDELSEVKMEKETADQVSAISSSLLVLQYSYRN